MLPPFRYCLNLINDDNLIETQSHKALSEDAETGNKVISLSYFFTNNLLR